MNFASTSLLCSSIITKPASIITMTIIIMIIIIIIIMIMNDHDHDRDRDHHHHRGSTTLLPTLQNVHVHFTCSFLRACPAAARGRNAIANTLLYTSGLRVRTVPLPCRKMSSST